MLFSFAVQVALADNGSRYHDTGMHTRAVLKIMAGESCGGPWDSYGTCAKGLTCQPDTTATPVLGAGGYFSENWDPVGTCVDPVAYKLEHSPCMRQLAAFLEFQKSRDKRSAGDSKSKLEKFPEIDLTTPTDLITMLVTETVAAESTQAQETVTAESTQTQMNETPPTTMRTTEAETTTGGREENTTVGVWREQNDKKENFV
nr:hypothetical protein BaRGS_014475 [Batillaria attramentaria]